MKTIHYIPCKVVFYNQYTQKEEDLIGKISKEKWLKFKELIEQKYIKILDQKSQNNII